MNRKRIAQQSKIQRMSLELEGYFSKYSELNFEQFIKEFKVENSIFSNKTLSRKNEAMN